MKKVVKKAVKKPVSKIDEFLEAMGDINPESLFPTDMKEAIVGYVERAGMSPQVLLDRKKCIDLLVKRDKMTHEDAEEFFEFNTIGAFVGNEGTPCFVTYIKDFMI